VAIKDSSTDFFWCRHNAETDEVDIPINNKVTYNVVHSQHYKVLSGSILQYPLFTNLFSGSGLLLKIGSPWFQTSPKAPDLKKSSNVN
jgi:hypothetical protein